ncbi:E3 ubiquitin-protein ligase TRIM39-like isoform X1 [Hypomesus transpacificus]|uniref:E3 ubiquitin-protein ligase TRIM39-like isoform X1 n=1 Tax=Hypomesus transpacificus TaxID=137520 RepID=UPI001F0714FA|nr:E3 ubiquitin-protein ligase TRIM39-like isoform X1 [Hypomesus transpacificus]XP_046906581.1 E3 ubiquitin-protein ligase TRIM39-like isoform X1 [Hypomesus transpacificus]XP_046906582.1 E3 ubiquitin-protein ligase TRIM39-like isoform X1 [Hypomesus transpacificus]XP_046906583.1 E3 ubiquitin-protein ligase TRIM39-like isoform X1 [Hypomesus transpacificus]
MASCCSLLSEDQFQCSICLDVFTDPVSTSCGHNFCKACITNYWDNSDLCQCPMCKEKFFRRPELRINTFISEMAAQFRKSEPLKATISPELRPTKPEVSCDICTGTKLKALKSCLVCLTSYCETHLEPHQRVVAFKKHKLIDPVENLEDRMCQKHERPLELFCRTDQTCVCLMCTRTDHKTHDTVTLEEMYEQRKVKLGQMMAEMNQMMEERSRKLQEIKLSVETSKRDAEREISDSVQVFTALLRSIERSQAELIEVMEEKQKAAEKQAEGLIQDLEQEITELKRRSTELEQLSHTEDHLHLLQSFPSLSTPPLTRDWSEISVHSGLSVGAVRRAVSELQKTLNKEMEKLPEVKLKRIQQYAMDVTLDPDTAYPKLILSENGKQVTYGYVRKHLPDNPERFDHCSCVLGKQGFSSGRFYYEVQVEGKTRWDLGVARESINRKGQITPRPNKGYWTVCLRNGDEYRALAVPRVLLSLRQKPQKVGVFVDYEEGLVSFYDVEARSHIYSFTGCTFTEKLYPYFRPSLNYGGKNSAPLIITPVTQ